jgi:hypothetical protein
MADKCGALLSQCGQNRVLAWNRLGSEDPLPGGEHALFARCSRDCVSGC